MITATAIDRIAAEVSAIYCVAEQYGLQSASVSGIYRMDSHSDGVSFRVCVSVNGTHAFQPRFRQREDAEAFREAVGAALDRLA